MARRGYPPEFRRRVVELVEGGRKVAEGAAPRDRMAKALGQTYSVGIGFRRSALAVARLMTRFA